MSKQMFGKKIPVILPVAWALIIIHVGCNTLSSTPSEATARKVFENMNQRPIKDGTIGVKNFRKTNGQSYELMGVKGYKLEYEA